MAQRSFKRRVRRTIFYGHTRDSEQMFQAIRLAAVACLSASILAASFDAARAEDPVGMWSTPDGGGVIAIAPCGDALCGRIVGISRAPGEPMPKDVHGVPQCGLTIIAHEKPTGDGAWLGDITDPRTGRMYGAKLWLDASGNLCLRGFVGSPLLGETQIWRPFSGHLKGACEFA